MRGMLAAQAALLALEGAAANAAESVQRFASAAKQAQTYSATPPAPLDKARRRAKQKAAAKARTAQRMRAKGKR